METGLPRNFTDDGTTLVNSVQCPLVQFLKRQFGIPPDVDSGTFALNHPDLSGIADQYQTNAGLRLFLAQYHTKTIFSIPETAPSTSILTLFISSRQSKLNALPSIRMATRWNPVSHGSQESCTQLVLCVSNEWLRTHLPPWVVSDENVLIRQIQKSLDHDEVLVNLMQSDSDRFWQLYPAQSLKPLFVWQHIYALLTLLFDRVIYNQKNNQLASPYLSADIRRVEAVYQYLISNLTTSSVTVAAMATMANMSLTKFNRLFKELYQMPVGEFVSNHRLQLARDLLATRQYTLTQIASKVGFTNPSGLTKLFRKKYGILPKDFLGSLR